MIEVPRHLELASYRSVGRGTRQFALAVVAASIVLLFYLSIKMPTATGRLSVATAFAAALFLAATLLLSVASTLKGARYPISTHMRRDFGIAAGLLALLHTAVGLQVHFNGEILHYFFHVADGRISNIRIDAFGFANGMGLVAACIFFVLLLISNNASIRTLGARRWKGIQNWSLFACILSVIHGFTYQTIEGRSALLVSALLLTVTATGIARAIASLRGR